MALRADILATRLSANIGKYCQPVTLINSTDAEIATVASGTTYTLANAVAKNTLGTTVDTKPYGQELAIGNSLITNSEDELLSSLPAEENYEVNDSLAQNTLGTVIAMIPAEGIEVIADSVIYKADGVTPLLSIPAETNKLTSDVITPMSSAEVNADLTLAKKLYIVQNYPSITAYHLSPATGQTTSYATGDDAYVETNIIAPVRARGIMPVWGDWYNLKTLTGNTNVFGNYKRYTGITGGYYDEATSQYKNLNGTVNGSLGNNSARLLSFPNGYIIDHYSGYGWISMKDTLLVNASNMGTPGNWSTLVARVWNVNVTVNGTTYTDWFLPNVNQATTIFNTGNLVSGTLYAFADPVFDGPSGDSAVRFTSTTWLDSTRAAYADGGRYFSLELKTFAGRVTPICRVHNF